MIEIELCKQSRGYCGPASLKMVLSAYEIRKSQNYLAKLTKTSRTKGCLEENIVKAGERCGLKGYVKQHSSINELRSFVNKGIPVIVDWFSPEEGGHYSAVVGFKKSKIIIADPHFGKLKKHSIKWFKDRWYDSYGGKKITREIIVLYK